MAEKEKNEQAKRLYDEIVSVLVESTGKKPPDRNDVLMVLAGVILETLFEFEEPEQAMEQSFSRVSDILNLDRFDAVLGSEKLVARPDLIDIVTEKGRRLARERATDDSGLGDIHEAAITLLINSEPLWQERPEHKAKDLRFVLECVMAGMLFEFAAQDLCDLMIEDFISQGLPVSDSVTALAGLSGARLNKATSEATGISSDNLFDVLIGETERHRAQAFARPDLKVANDVTQPSKPSIKIVESLLEPIIDYFEQVGLQDPGAQATAIAKAGGRMLAVLASDKLGKIQASVVQSTAKSALTEYATQKA